ncbi:hypothetical protein [Sphingopyxis sp. MG]|uniref:hypothetical protein n=1 Tax=Sphingopyxis sp. MG TaxID=1866325 RepID=UPI000CDF517A|nr:hypothetical protein [Sphingopyxis sp. MG]AVA13496.1 hypothetical protein C3E99_06235 [Sphingopyxis sp. MG]
MRADLLRFEAEAAAFIDAHRDMREASGFYGQGANVFLGWLENKVGLKGEDLRPNPSGSEADGVEIVTWHASKGREWPIVVVCGLDHKLDPRAGTFSTKFPGFDDLDHVIEEATLAYPRLHVEQPIEVPLSDGGSQSIILDLIAEGPNGFMIVDHKSGAVADHELRFERYWPQLAAYIDAVDKRGDKAVRGAAVFWTETGDLTLGQVLCGATKRIDLMTPDRGMR